MEALVVFCQVMIEPQSIKYVKRLTPMKTNQPVVQSTAQQPLVQVVKNQIVTTSLQIAKHFEREHKEVLRAIRNLECSVVFQGRNFALSFYHRQLANGGYKKDPLYYITRDGFTFLAMGFTGKVAAKFKEDYINAFNEMEKSLRDIHEKGLVSAKLFKDQKIQTEYWKGVANSGIGNMVQMSDGMKKLAEMLVESRNATKDFRPKKFYYLTEEYFNVVVKSFADWLYYENINGFVPGVRDHKLVEKFEAARLLYFNPNTRLPVHQLYSPEKR